MDRILLAIAVGLLSGAAGGFVVHHFGGPPAESGGVEIGGTSAPGEAAADRLWARIEAKLDAREAAAPATLATRPATAPPVADDPGAGRTLSDADVGALAEAMRAHLDPAVREAVKEAASAGELVAAAEEAPRKKRVSLAEAAKELQLSAAEEDALRGVYDRMGERAIEILAGPDGDKQEVRRDLEAASTDPAQRATLMTKYLPKVLPRIGEFIVLDQERRQGVRDAVGAEKADRLENEFNIEEQDPFGFGGNSRMEVRGRR